jgi:hypothetical protein
METSKRLEKEIENESLDWLNKRPGIFAVKTDNSAPYNEQLGGRIKKNRFSPRGYPDCTVFIKSGKTFFIEFKTRTGKQSDAQIAFQKKVESLGFGYYVCRDLVDTMNALERETER